MFYVNDSRSTTQTGWYCITISIKLTQIKNRPCNKDKCLPTCQSLDSQKPGRISKEQGFVGQYAGVTVLEQGQHGGSRCRRCYQHEPRRSNGIYVSVCVHHVSIISYVLLSSTRIYTIMAASKEAA